MRLRDRDAAELLRDDAWEPESTRWVTKSTDTDQFMLRWGKDGDLFDAAKSIPTARWNREKRGVSVLPEQFEQVLDFATAHGFQLSPGAKDLINKTRQEREAALQLAPQERASSEHDDGRPELPADPDATVPDHLPGQGGWL